MLLGGRPIGFFCDLVEKPGTHRKVDLSTPRWVHYGAVATEPLEETNNEVYRAQHPKLDAALYNYFIGIS